MTVKKATLFTLAAVLFAGIAVEAHAGGCSKGGYGGYGGSYAPRTYYKPVCKKPAPRPIHVVKPVHHVKPVAPPATMVPVGAVITLPGHGFGTHPGRILLSLPGLQLHVPVGKWTPNAIEIKLPELALTHPTLAQLQILRADGFKIAPLHLKLTPAAVQGIVIGTPAAPQAAPATPAVQTPVIQTSFGQQNAGQ